MKGTVLIKRELLKISLIPPLAKGGGFKKANKKDRKCGLFYIAG